MVGRHVHSGWRTGRMKVIEGVPISGQTRPTRPARARTICAIDDASVSSWSTDSSLCGSNQSLTQSSLAPTEPPRGWLAEAMVKSFVQGPSTEHGRYPQNPQKQQNHATDCDDGLSPWSTMPITSHASLFGLAERAAAICGLRGLSFIIYRFVLILSKPVSPHFVTRMPLRPPPSTARMRNGEKGT